MKLVIPALVMMAALTGAPIVLNATEQPYLVYKNLPWEPIDPVVQKGDVVPLHVIRCNTDSKKHTYTLTRSLVNISTGQPYVLRDTTVEISPGCHDETSLANDIPNTAVIRPGRYKFVGLANIEGRWRSNMHVPWDSQEFTVVERTKQ